MSKTLGNVIDPLDVLHGNTLKVRGGGGDLGLGVSGGRVTNIQVVDRQAMRLNGCFPRIAFIYSSIQVGAVTVLLHVLVSVHVLILCGDAWPSCQCH